MDLRVYYQQIRAVEREIVDRDAVVVSVATRDGGKAGVLSEVPRGLAAGLIVDGRARLATSEEVAQFHTAADEARQRAAGIAAPLYNSGRVIVAALSGAKKNSTKRGQ